MNCATTSRRRRKDKYLKRGSQKHIELAAKFVKGYLRDLKTVGRQKYKETDNYRKTNQNLE